MSQSLSLTYVSNAGVLLSIADRKILIDGLCKGELPLWKNTPVSIREQIIGAKPPFDNIDVVLITHHHPDHFDPEGIREFAKQNPHVKVVSNRKVIAGITETFGFELANLIETEPGHSSKKIINGIKIRAIPMLHHSQDLQHVENLAYLVEYGIKLLHIGDAAPVMENYQPLQLNKYKLDLLIAPFPYVGLPTARRIVSQYINPNQIAIVHFPHNEFDREGWIPATKNSYERVQHDFVQTHFLEELGSSIHLTFPIKGLLKPV